MLVQPYLNYDGRCEEAIEFYKKAVNAKVEMLMRFKDSPEPTPMPVDGNKVMHSSLKIGDSVIMASDGHCANQHKFDGISLSLTVSDDAEAQKVFAALSEGGKVTMPLTKTFFSSNFGMLADRFGLMWMIMVVH